MAIQGNPRATLRPGKDETQAKDEPNLCMNTCTYCGRLNHPAAVNCQECGTDLQPAPAATGRQEAPSPRSHPVGAIPPLSGPQRSVASTGPQTAQLLVDRLLQESIPARIEVVKHESGMDWFEVVVEEPDYDSAYRVAESWEEELAAEQDRNSNRACPQCNSRRHEFVTTETFGHVWRCLDCGRAFLG